MFGNNKKIDINSVCYILDDGRIWSVASCGFIPSVPEGANASKCPDSQGNSTVEGLIGCLDFYGYDKGELKTDAEYAAEARAKRNSLIAETDYLVMPDYPLPEDKKQAVLAYRQALRDIPEQAGFPRQIDWPVKP